MNPKMREMPTEQPAQQAPQGMPDLSQIPPEVLMQLLQLLTSQGGGGLPGFEDDDEGPEEDLSGMA